MRRLIPIVIILAIGVCPLQGGAVQSEEPIFWQGWSDQVFERAKQEGKFVILDLEAIWCHWCHVMAETTYKDPKVVELMRAKYIPVRVDQDANPDLSLRYEDWGWPATIIFGPDGQEIAKRRGYVPPEAMSSLLEAVIKDPTPGPSVSPEVNIKPAKQALLTENQQKYLKEEHVSMYDNEFGGWGMIHKLIDSNNLEYAMMEAQAGDKTEEAMARHTLDQALNLLDLEWGGFFQYSDERDWKSPHYEKIMSIQSEYMQLYAFAYALWNEPRYLDATQKVESYIANFWTSPDGAFYTSQDADVNIQLLGHAFYSLNDVERKKLGRAPKIDTHVYSRENGWIISSLTYLYDVTGDQTYLDQAIRAAKWILKNRNLPGGGFRHDTQDRSGPYLGDTLSMGEAFLDLYTSTGDRNWLKRSEEAAKFIHKFFKDEKGGGFATAAIPANAMGAFQKPVKQIEENLNTVRWANRLFHYTGKTEYRTMAEHAMRYLASPAIIFNRRFLIGLLLADRELAQDPVHIAIVGSKNDPKAKMLFQAALHYPANYRRVEWFDKREGSLPNADVSYPDLKQSAAFVCANRTCSLPFFSPEKIAQTLSQSQKRGADLKSTPVATSAN